MDVGGILLAVLAAIFNGSFGTLSKIKRVQEAQVISPPKNASCSRCTGNEGLGALPYPH